MLLCGCEVLQPVEGATALTAGCMFSLYLSIQDSMLKVLVLYAYISNINEQEGQDKVSLAIRFD